MALDQMQVFNEYVMPVIIETLPQSVEKFNQMSRGAIQLTGEGFDGDFLQKSFWSSIHSAQRRVNRNGVNGTAPITDLSQKKDVTVKVAGGFGPVRYEPSQLTWLSKPTAEGIEVISRNVVESIVADQLNTGIASTVAALSNNATTFNADAAPLTNSMLNSSHALFGDKSNNLIAEVMTGLAFHTLIGNNLNNVERLYSSDSVQIVDILGRVIVVTDSPALLSDPNGFVLSLVSGGITVMDGGNMIANIETNNGGTRIESTMQFDYDFGVNVKGFAWDADTAGSSPDDVTLGTGTNWLLNANTEKETAGVCTSYTL